MFPLLVLQQKFAFAGIQKQCSWYYSKPTHPLELLQPNIFDNPKQSKCLCMIYMNASMFCDKQN